MDLEVCTNQSHWVNEEESMSQTTTDMNASYTGVRMDVVDLIPESVSRLLDIGCSVGSIGKEVKIKAQHCKVFGIEYDESMAKIAEQAIDGVLISDLNKIKLLDHYEPANFDCVVAADILEHLLDPWSMLDQIITVLSPGGYIVVSLPNVSHVSTFVSLLRKEWPYRDRGIHDKTHLRFFSLRNILTMFNSNDIEIVRLERNMRLIEKPHRFNRISKLLNIWPIRDYFTYQYLILVKKRK